MNNFLKNLGGGDASKSNEQKQETTSRQPLTTEDAARKKIAKEVRKYQKENRASHLESYNAKKSIINGLNGDDLGLYILDTLSDANETRVGIATMKINAHEAAIIKLAVELSPARSSRELFLTYCKQILKESGKY